MPEGAQQKKEQTATAGSSETELLGKNCLDSRLFESYSCPKWMTIKMSEPKPMNELFATMDVYTGHIPCFLLSAGFLHISISKSSIYIVLISWNDNRYY